MRPMIANNMQQKGFVHHHGLFDCFACHVSTQDFLNFDLLLLILQVAACMLQWVPARSTEADGKVLRYTVRSNGARTALVPWKIG